MSTKTKIALLSVLSVVALGCAQSSMAANLNISESSSGVAMVGDLNFTANDWQGLNSSSFTQETGSINAGLYNPNGGNGSLGIQINNAQGVASDYLNLTFNNGTFTASFCSMDDGQTCTIPSSIGMTAQEDASGNWSLPSVISFLPNMSIEGTSMTAPVPEPSDIALMLTGLGLVSFAIRRRAAK